MRKIILLVIVGICVCYGFYKYQQRVEAQKKHQEWLKTRSFDQDGNLIYTKEEIEEENNLRKELDLSDSEFANILAKDMGYDYGLYARTFIDNGVRHSDDEGCEISAYIYIKRNNIDKISAGYCNGNNVIIRSFSYENDLLKIIDNRGSIHFLKIIRR